MSLRHAWAFLTRLPGGAHPADERELESVRVSVLGKKLRKGNTYRYRDFVYRPYRPRP